MKIRLLPPEIASQIAAGEVVERPASVVKELLENALDSGAGKVDITIAGAGRTLIQVADDGEGIPEEEMELAVARHATSKLVSAEDLFRIRTLGFRGEALASIGSVSRLTITSRTRHEESASRIRVDGGLIARVEKTGAPFGTQVRVEALFQNIPARLKFLKQDITERRAIDTLVARYALAYPQVRLKLLEGETTFLQTAGDGDRRAILASLYGVETGRSMLEVQAEESGMRLTGFISPVSLTRSNRREITFFINGRWVQDTPLNAALLQAYHTLLMTGRYPLAMLFLELPPEEVDVNVHPAKAEVRFRRPDAIFSFIQRATRRALLAYSPVPQGTVQNLWKETVRQTSMVDPAWQIAHPDGDLLQADAMLVEPGGEAGSGLPASSETVPPRLNVPLLRLVGQVGASYLVAEGPDGLYLVDQHAAHERVLFEKLMAQHDVRAIPAQELLTPAVVTLSPALSRMLEAQLSILEHFGFHVEPFGTNAFRVSAVPALFASGDPAAAVQALVEDFEEDETPLKDEQERRIAGRVCKRMAVKAGQVLTPDEQRQLLVSLEACASPRTCPHGRPTMIHLSVDMLERQFGRRGAR